MQGRRTEQTLPASPQVMVQCVGGSAPLEQGELYQVVSQGAFELWISGSKMGTMSVGEWQCRVFGERGAPLQERLSHFYQQHCPAKLPNVPKLVHEFGLGKEAELNAMLLETYGADLTTLTDHATHGWLRASVRRIAPLIFYIHGAMPIDEGREGAQNVGGSGVAMVGGGSGMQGRDYAVTFPPPYAKRTRFIEELELVFAKTCTYTNEVPQVLLQVALNPEADNVAISGATQPLAQGLAGFDQNYIETSVPEKRGPLRRGSDGRAFYGSKIEAGGHQLSTGLRDGSVWISGKMVQGTKRFSEWLGPAASEANINPRVKQGLEYAQVGTGKVLDLTCDVIGSLGNAAAKGVAWGADKVSQTETYKSWEKKPSGPRAKAAREVAESTVAAIFTVGYGLKDATHTLLEAGVMNSVVHASQARWGEQAGEAADKSCQSFLNLHYTLIYAGHFLEKGAKEVVGHLGKMMVLDVATKALLIDDLKSGVVRLESALLVNEFMGFGGRTSVWNCFVCVLRERTLALYVPIVTEGAGKLGTAGLRVRALFKGGHKIIDYIEPGGAAECNGSLEIGDVIMGVDGIPAEKLTVDDIESILTGQAGSLLRLQVCSGKELQAHADQVQARADIQDLERAGLEPTESFVASRRARASGLRCVAGAK